MGVEKRKEENEQSEFRPALTSILVEVSVAAANVRAGCAVVVRGAVDVAGALVRQGQARRDIVRGGYCEVGREIIDRCGTVDPGACGRAVGDSPVRVARDGGPALVTCCVSEMRLGVNAVRMHVVGNTAGKPYIC